MSQMHSIFQLTEGDARHGGRVLEFICSSYTKKKAEELLPAAWRGLLLHLAMLRGQTQ